METEALYLLSFDPVLQVIEHGLAHFSPRTQYDVSVREFVGHLLEELSVKIWDRDATSHIAPAAHYLKIRGVDEEMAQQFSQDVFNALFNLVIGCFPGLTFQELAAGRFILDTDGVTLLVYLKQRAYA
jgi:hypothetical protein